tara:strand:+ start:518 stop:751 length:234 start_codon:yes stop_codon:yes gene_type:complete
MTCGLVDGFEKNLESEYNERLVGIGITEIGSVMRLYKSDEGSFTVILTDTNNVSCLPLAGNSWQTLKPKKKVKGTGL